MARFETYQIIRSVQDLPPRDILVFVDTTTLDQDLLSLNGVIAIDIEFDNRDAVNVANITVNNEDPYVLSANTSKAHSNIAVSRFRVDTSTDFQVICHVISLALLLKLNAVEVR